jgi:hypothetical protein
MISNIVRPHIFCCLFFFFILDKSSMTINQLEQTVSNGALSYEKPGNFETNNNKTADCM